MPHGGSFSLGHVVPDSWLLSAARSEGLLAVSRGLLRGVHADDDTNCHGLWGL